MSIIWCGGEKIDFVKNSPVPITYYNGANYHRTDYCRGSLQLGGGDPTPYYSNNFVSSVGSGTWFHCQMHSQTSNPDTNTFVFGLRNSVTGDAIGVGFDANDYWSIGKRTSAGTVTWFVSEASKTFTNTINQYDLHIATYGSSGSIHFYVNGSLLLTYSGDITVGSTTDFNQVRLSGLSSVWGAFISEIIVADEDTRLMSLKTLIPNAAGDTSEWDGDYTNIDDNLDQIGFSDADTVHTDVAEEDMQFNLTGMPAGDFICKGVKIIARATDGVGGIGMQMGIKTNSVLHLGDTITLSGAWEQNEFIYQQNPETTSRFTPAEIDALQLAFRSKSTT